MVFHHIGVASIDINRSIETYINLGYAQYPTKIFEDTNQNVKIAFIIKSGSPLIEIVAPLSQDSHLVSLLSKIGAGPYHTCYEIKDIDEEIKILKAKKFMVISSPKEAIAFNNRRVAFLFNKFVGIIELLEE